MAENEKKFIEKLKNAFLPAFITSALAIPTTIVSVNYSTGKNFDSWIEQNKIQYETQLQQEVLKKRLELIEELSNLYAQRELAEMDSTTFLEAYRKNVEDNLDDTDGLAELFEKELNETIMEDKEKYKVLNEWQRKWSQLETKSYLYFGENTRNAFQQYWEAGGNWYQLDNLKENKEELFYNILNTMRDELNTPLPEHLIVDDEEEKY